MKEESFENVWDAIEDDPVIRESLKLRSVLMIELTDYIKHKKWTHIVAAKRLGVTQPCIYNLMRGKIDSFDIDTLVKMATLAGLRITLHVKKAA